MLVLSRERGESIVLDFSGMTDDELRALRDAPIEVEAVDLRLDKVRLGTTAPKCVAVHRNEIYQAIRSGGRGAWRPMTPAVAAAGGR